MVNACVCGSHWKIYSFHVKCICVYKTVCIIIPLIRKLYYWILCLLLLLVWSVPAAVTVAASQSSCAHTTRHTPHSRSRFMASSFQSGIKVGINIFLWLSLWSLVSTRRSMFVLLVLVSIRKPYRFAVRARTLQYLNGTYFVYFFFIRWDTNINLIGS